MLAIEGRGGEGDQPHKMDASIEIMKKHSMPYQTFDGTELRKAYPMLKFSDDHKGVLDPEAGTLFASKCIIAIQV